MLKRFRPYSTLILPAAILTAFLPARPAAAQEDTGRWGPLTGIRELGIRVPVSGELVGEIEGTDPSTLHYSVRDFLVPRAPGISVVTGNPPFRLQVRFSFRKIPPESEETSGILVLSWSWLESREERLADREYEGGDPPPLHTVERMRLWNSSPAFTFVEDPAYIQGEIGKLIETHLNRFLDAWFRDNAGGRPTSSPPSEVSVTRS
jgi:hypothetical protein